MSAESIMRYVFWIAIGTVNVLTWGFVLLGFGVTHEWWPNPFLSDECRGAPKVVEFHQGMSLCPGQSTTIQVIIPIPDDTDDDGPAVVPPAKDERSL